MSPRLLRQWHGYVGAFIAPSVLFFALTGALQLFSLHEAHGRYHPAPIVERLGRLHKDQVFAPGEHHGAPHAEAQPGAARGEAGGPAAHGDADHDDDDQPAVATYLLKWFFLAVALGLALSTVFGIWIALTRPQGRRATLGLMLVGAVVPLILLAI